MTVGSPWRWNRGATMRSWGIGVLEHRPLHHSPDSVASSPEPPAPMSGTRSSPMLVQESPAPHYIMVEDSRARLYIVVEEPPMPMSGVKYRPCLVPESPEPIQDRGGTKCTVPKSGTKDRPSLVDDSAAVPKVRNPCGGGENLVERGSATLPINLVSPPGTTFPVEGPQPRVLTGARGEIQRLQQARSRFCASHSSIQSPTVVHESPQYVVVEECPSPARQPNPVGPTSPSPSPRQGLRWSA